MQRFFENFWGNEFREGWFTIMVKPHYDAVVVGLGGVGTFALRALAKEASFGPRKRSFLGVELGTIFPFESSGSSATPEAGHSSRGQSRIYRRAYFEHANYVPWIEHSLNVFREMERANGVSLMKECGMLLIEPSKSTAPTTTINQVHLEGSSLPPYISSSWNSAKLHNIPVEFIDSKQLKKRFPQFHVRRNTNMVGLLEPGGGFLRPERIMKVALQEALSHDTVVILDRTRVTEIENFPGRGKMQLRFELKGSVDVEVTTNKLLISMGAWTSTILPSWKHFLHPVRQVQGWIDTREGPSNLQSMYSSEEMPAFVYISPDFPEALYGVPCDDDCDGAGMVAGDVGTESTDPKHWLKVGIHKQDISKGFSLAGHLLKSSVSEKEELQKVVPLCIDTRTWSKPKAIPLAHTKPCLYTMTPDKHFVIGQASPNIFCVAGLSGHGFKMTPSLGQMMADFAFGKDNLLSHWNAEFCSPKRFRLLTKFWQFQGSNMVSEDYFR